MALFGFGREPEQEAPTARELAEKHYRKLESGFAAQRLTLHTVHPAPPFSAESYFFAREQDEFLFLPALDVYGATEEELQATEVLRYPAERLVITKEDPIRTPERREGILDLYPILPVTLRFAVDGGKPAVFTAGNVESTAKFLSRYLPDCALRGAYDMMESPADAPEVLCKKGRGLLPDGARFSVWREGDTLRFLRQNYSLYQRTGNVQYGVLPLSAIESFGQEGEVRYETRVLGGEVTIDRSAAYWSGWAHPFTFNPIGHALEDAVSSTPVRSEQIPHDERYIELRVRWHGRRAELEFDSKAAEVFTRLMPEKSEENLPTDREPTIPEQIEILANICDRGYLTREEFEEAKQKLLKKL